MKIIITLPIPIVALERYLKYRNLLFSYFITACSANMSQGKCPRVKSRLGAAFKCFWAETTPWEPQII